MADTDLVLKRLAQIESSVAELRSLARLERLETDVREERFVECTLQMAIQAAINSASQIVADERLGEPNSRMRLFELLQRAGWLDAPLAHSMRALAGFRDTLVHEYLDIDLAEVRRIVSEQLDDLLRFATVIRARVQA